MNWRILFCAALLWSVAMASSTLTYKTLTCGMCETTYNLMDNFLAKNSTNGEDMDMVVCALFPTTLQGRCMDIFSNYYALMFQYVESGYSSDVACFEMNLCNNMRPIMSRF